MMYNVWELAERLMENPGYQPVYIKRNDGRLIRIEEVSTDKKDGISVVVIELEEKAK